MPLYVGDYLSDTMHLDGAQHGAYLLLLMHYWRGSEIPNEEKKLASIARTSMKAWNTHVGPAVMPFFTIEGGMLRQKRMDLELLKAQDISTKRRAAVLQRADRTPTNDIQSSYKSSTIVGDLYTHAGARQSHKKVSKEDLPPTPFTSLTGVTPCPTTGRPLVNGLYLDTASEMAMEAAHIDPARWRGDFRPIIAWLADDIYPQTIRAAIERVAAKPGYKPPFSLAYFDRAVREQPQEIDK